MQFILNNQYANFLLSTKRTNSQNTVFIILCKNCKKNGISFNKNEKLMKDYAKDFLRLSKTQRQPNTCVESQVEKTEED